MKQELTYKRRRVAWVFPTLTRGWRWQPVLRAFVKLFPNTVVFVGDWPGFIRGCEGTFEVRQLRGGGFVTLRRSATGSPKGFVWASPLALWDLLRFNPDVVFINGFSLCTVYALIVKALVGSRVILLWQGISPETGGEPGSLRLWLRKVMAPFLDMTICNTAHGVAYLRNLVGIPASKVLHDPFEVADARTFTALERNAKVLKSLDHPTFLFVGRITRGKGIHKLLQACSLLVEKGLNRFSIMLVGDGIHKQEMERLALSLGLNQRVRWEEAVRYEHVGAYYKACDVFVLPSLEDTWGVVLLEAMGFGKPVLCSQNAGSQEMIQPGVNGFVFDPYNPRELADYMERFIREPGLIPKFGSKSKEIVAGYTPERTANVFATLISELPARYALH